MEETFHHIVTENLRYSKAIWQSLTTDELAMMLEQYTVDMDFDNYYDMHEEILLAYCGCYGVDSTDVELLLDYGYTCDEIEEMLVDHCLLREALKDVKYIWGEDMYENCYG